MIKVFWTPQVLSSQDKMEYEFNGEQIRVTINNVEDVFDFSSLPDGGLDSSRMIETLLHFCPIISAKRVGGILHLELLNWVGSDAPYDSRFPEWVSLPLPIKSHKPVEYKHLAVIPWLTQQEIDSTELARAQASLREKERRERIKDGLTGVKTHGDLLQLVKDIAAELGLADTT